MPKAPNGDAALRLAGYGVAAWLLVDLMLHRLPAADRRAMAREALANLELDSVRPRNRLARETAQRVLTALLPERRS